MTTQRAVFLKLIFFIFSLVSSAAAVHVARKSQSRLFNCHLFHQFILLDMATTIVVITTMKLKGGYRVDGVEISWISVC